MKKLLVFGIVLVSSLIGFAVSLYSLAVTYQAQPAGGYMADMMRNMMGGQVRMGASEPVEAPIYILVLPFVFIGLFILGVGGLLYFLVVPEIKVSPQVAVEPAERPSATFLRGEKVSTLLNTMKPEERKVFEVLTSHGGKYLQKHISKEADLSRLKTHRIIARFAERGIVTVRPFGNTNEVAFSEWLTSEN